MGGEYSEEHMCSCLELHFGQVLKNFQKKIKAYSKTTIQCLFLWNSLRFNMAVNERS